MHSLRFLNWKPCTASPALEPWGVPGARESHSPLGPGRASSLRSLGTVVGKPLSLRSKAGRESQDQGKAVRVFPFNPSPQSLPPKQSVHLVSSLGVAVLQLQAGGPALSWPPLSQWDPAENLWTCSFFILIHASFRQLLSALLPLPEQRSAASGHRSPTDVRRSPPGGGKTGAWAPRGVKLEQL